MQRKISPLISPFFIFCYYYIPVFSAGSGPAHRRGRIGHDISTRGVGAAGAGKILDTGVRGRAVSICGPFRFDPYLVPPPSLPPITPLTHPSPLQLTIIQSTTTTNPIISNYITITTQCTHIHRTTFYRRNLIGVLSLPFY